MARSATVRLVLAGREHDGTSKRNSGRGELRVSGRSCCEVHGTCDSRINLYPAAPIRLAKVLLAWTIAQVGWDSTDERQDWYKPICEMEEQPRIRPARHTRVGCRN